MQIPIYGNEEVAPNEMPGVQVQPITDAAGEAALGQGIEHLGEGADKLGAAALDAYKQHSKAAAADAFNSWQRDASAPLYGTTAESEGGSAGAPSASQSRGDAAFSGVNGAGMGPPGFTRTGSSDTLPEGLFNAQGQRAAAAGGPTMDYLGKRAAEVEDSLGNPIAKQYFRQMVQPQLAEYHRQIEVHSAQQLKAAKELTEQTTAKTSFGNIAAGVDNAATPEDVFTVTQAAVDPVHKTIDALNPDTAVAAAKKAAYDQEAYYGVVKQLVDEKRDPVSAEAFLKSHEKEIAYGENGRDRVGHLRESIERLKNQTADDGFATKVINGAMNPDSQLTDLGKARTDLMNSVADLPKPQRDARIKSFDDYAAVAEKRNKDLADAQFNSALSAFQQGGSRLAAVPPTLATWMQKYDAKGWQTLMDHERTAHPRASSRSNEVTQPQIEAAKILGDMAAHPEKYDPAQGGMNPAEFARQNIGRLDKETYRQVSGKQAEIIGAGQKGAGAGLPTDGMQAVLEAGHGKLWDKEQPAKMTDDSAKAYGHVVQVAEDFRKKFKASHGGKEPTRADYDQAVAPEMLNVTTPGTFGMLLGGDQVPLAKYETSPDYADKNPVPAAKVPDDWHAVISHEVQAARGRPATEEEVHTIYLAKLRKLSRQQAPPAPAPAAPAASPTTPAPAAPAKGDQPDFVPQQPHAQLRAPEKKKAGKKGKASAQAELPSVPTVEELTGSGDGEEG